MRSYRFASFALAASLMVATPAAAQFPVDTPLAGDPHGALERPAPVSLAYVDGRVDLVRPDGVQAAEAPDLLQEDDRLVTAEGRAELVLDDGSVAHVDRLSDVRIDLGVRLRLVSGRLVVHTPPDIDALYVSTPAGPVRLAARGVYDLTADDLRGDTVIAVREGHAALEVGDTETPVGADDVLQVDPRDLKPRWARGTQRDAFLDWSDRRLRLVTADRHAALPGPLQPWAADLAAHGQWSTLPTYGAVWFPSAGPSWRPYQYGSWRYTRYGWTWIDTDRWAWPVHHYGRWGHHASRGWYWMPHRAWGPAWVGWAVAADHVAWSPLGWDRRPLVDFSVGARLGPVGLFASSWSILPRHAFGRRGPIYRDLQDPRYLAGPVLGGFVSQMIGPRGPAGPGDRFAVRPGYRVTPSTSRPVRRGGVSEPPIAYQPRQAEPARGERSPDAPVRRRPMDAPPVDPAVNVWRLSARAVGRARWRRARRWRPLARRAPGGGASGRAGARPAWRGPAGALRREPADRAARRRRIDWSTAASPERWCRRSGASARRRRAPRGARRRRPWRQWPRQRQQP